MSKKELSKRYAVLIVGLFFAGLGVAFTKHGNLGVSPISSVANVVSIKIPSWSLGNLLIVWNCILILAQILILRKDFKLYQLLQIPLSFLFGWFTDFGMWLAGPLPADIYPLRLLMLFIGILLLSFGISLSFLANVIMNSGEALVKAISDKTHFEFGYVKVGFDIFCVVVSIVLSLIFFNGKIVGTREGTIITAVCTGFVVKAISGKLRNKVLSLFSES